MAMGETPRVWTAHKPKTLNWREQLRKDDIDAADGPVKKLPCSTFKKDPAYLSFLNWVVKDSISGKEDLEGTKSAYQLDDNCRPIMKKPRGNDGLNKDGFYLDKKDVAKAEQVSPYRNKYHAKLVPLQKAKHPDMLNGIYHPTTRSAFVHKKKELRG
jgi:hypothetical protein